LQKLRVLGFPQGSGGVAEAFFIHSELLQHAQVKVRERYILAQIDVAAGL
jgi:hypothetical protein